MDVVDYIAALHRTVDELVEPLLATHGERLRCKKGCNSCCQDNIKIFDVEAERIRRERPDVLAQEAAPLGGCAFLGSEGECRIYEQRPYVCRTQGVPLRWLEQGPEEDVFEARDVCPRNGANVRLRELAVRDCFTVGPFEARLAQAQAHFGLPCSRVTLRSLFDEQE